MQLERLDFFRKRILTDRVELIRSITSIDGEISAYMEQQPIEFNERGEDAAVVNLLDRLDLRQKKELSLMEEALSRIQTGTYGICTRCGNDISEARLMALPLTTLCKICARKETSS
jgi:RNA polymerase-binding transcription factor DksA